MERQPIFKGAKYVRSQHPASSGEYAVNSFGDDHIAYGPMDIYFDEDARIYYAVERNTGRYLATKPGSLNFEKDWHGVVRRSA
jgi:hypothetical protein